MVNFWKKKIKDTNAIANKIGVEESKIKELVNGEREIEGNTLDKVLQTIEDEKVNESIKNVEILQWYRDTDITALRKKFGYKSQSEFAKKIGYNVSVICRIENKTAEWKNKGGKFNGVPNSLKKVYYFFQNDFNRKNKNDSGVKIEPAIQDDIQEKDIYKWYKNTDITALRGDKTLKEKAEEIGIAVTCLNEIEHKKAKSVTENIIKVYEFYNNVKVNVVKSNNKKITNKENKEIWKWYKKTNILELRKNQGLSQMELAKLLGISQPSVGEVENKKTKSVSPAMKRLYEFYTKMVITNMDQENLDETIMKWYNDVKDFSEYRRKFGYSKNKFMAVLNLSNDQTREFERHNYKSATPVVKRIYEFYHNEKNRLPEIEWTPNDNNTWVSGNMTITTNNEELQAVIMPQNDNEYIEEIAKLKEEIEQLKAQISRYEKIIDRL